MIWLNSSEAEDKSIAETKEEREEGSMCAAFAAAAWTSRGASEAGRGSELAKWGKLRMAAGPLMLRAATSCALAAISGVGNVPSHIRDFFLGSRISDTHFPQFRIRTPRYKGCLLESPPPRMRFIFLVSGSISVETLIVIGVVKSRELNTDKILGRGCFHLACKWSEVKFNSCEFLFFSFSRGHFSMTHITLIKVHRGEEDGPTRDKKNDSLTRHSFFTRTELQVGWNDLGRKK